MLSVNKDSCTSSFPIDGAFDSYVNTNRCGHQNPMCTCLQRVSIVTQNVYVNSLNYEQNKHNIWKSSQRTYEGLWPILKTTQMWWETPRIQSQRPGFEPWLPASCSAVQGKDLLCLEPFSSYKTGRLMPLENIWWVICCGPGLYFLPNLKELSWGSKEIT